MTRLWPIFRSPRFLNGVLARWVLTGGLTNPTNRQDIGLIAERLATLDKSQGGKGLISSKGPKGKGRGLWEETTSNATTVVTTRGGGGARLGDELPGSSLWLGSGGERPASSATSRASRPSAARRPPCRASAAAAPSTAATAKAAAAAGGGTQHQIHRQQHGSSQHLSSEGRGGGGRVDGRRADKVAAAPGGGRGAVAGHNVVGGAERPSRAVPRLRLHRAESRLVLAPSLLTLRTPVVLSSSRRGRGAAALSGSGSREAGSDVAPRRRRASSASSSRPPSTHRQDGSGTSRGGNPSGGGGSDAPPPVVSLEVKPLSFTSALSTGERWGPQVAALPAPLLCLPGAAEVVKKTNATPRRRSLQQHQDREQVFAISNSRVPALPDGGGGATAAVSPRGVRREVTGRNSNDQICFPRPPCRAAGRAEEVATAVTANGDDPFATGLMPFRYAGATSSTDGPASFRSFSGASLRCRAVALADSSQQGASSRIVDSMASVSNGGAPPLDAEPARGGGPCESTKAGALATREELFPGAAAASGRGRSVADCVRP